MRVSSGVTTSSTSSKAGKSPYVWANLECGKGSLKLVNSLEKNPKRRGYPWKMLEHPWMIELKSKKVNMGKYLAQVWGWDTKGSK